MKRNYIDLTLDQIKLDDVLNIVSDGMPESLLIVIRDHKQDILCSGVNLYGKDAQEFLVRMSLHVRKRKNPEDRWEHWEALNDYGVFDEDILQKILNRRE